MVFESTWIFWYRYKCFGFSFEEVTQEGLKDKVHYLLFFLWFTGHFYDGACTRMAIDESTGAQLSLSEWKWKQTSQRKKVHFTAAEADDNAFSKQVCLLIDWLIDLFGWLIVWFIAHSINWFFLFWLLNLHNCGFQRWFQFELVFIRGCFINLRLCWFSLIHVGLDLQKIKISWHPVI